MTNNLEKFRKEQSLTQEQLAKKSGVARTIISKMENGKVDDIKLSTLRSLSQALNVNISDIFML